MTDRAQTGLYQTNREKRWEAHPNSVHYANRVTAWEIEGKLLKQICFFQGFPVEALERLVDKGIVGDEPHTRCPITLEPLSFFDFASEMLNPNHGRSTFQVGHLSPLKALDRRQTDAGHTSNNISWITSVGNRFQGDMSVQETLDLITRIAARLQQLDR